MFDFDEEIERFTPSTEIDQAEERVLKGKNLDITDILEELLKENRRK